MGLDEGRAFLHRDHPCWSALGLDPLSTEFNLFENKVDFSAGRQTLLTGNLNAKNKDTEKRDAAAECLRRKKDFVSVSHFLFHVMMWNLYNSTFDVELIPFHIIPHLMWNLFNSTQFHVMWNSSFST